MTTGPRTLGEHRVIVGDAPQVERDAPRIDGQDGVFGPGIVVYRRITPTGAEHAAHAARVEEEAIAPVHPPNELQMRVPTREQARRIGGKMSLKLVLGRGWQ